MIESVLCNADYKSAYRPRQTPLQMCKMTVLLFLTKMLFDTFVNRNPRFGLERCFFDSFVADCPRSEGPRVGSSKVRRSECPKVRESEGSTRPMVRGPQVEGPRVGGFEGPRVGSCEGPKVGGAEAPRVRRLDSSEGPRVLESSALL